MVDTGRQRVEGRQTPISAHSRPLSRVPAQELVRRSDRDHKRALWGQRVCVWKREKMWNT